MSNRFLYSSSFFRIIKALSVFLSTLLAFATHAAKSVPELTSRSIGLPAEGEPWICNVNAVDLDQDGLEDVLVCDGKLNTLTWIRQLPSGGFREIVLSDAVPGPVHTDVLDLDSDGFLDILVSCMGIVTPNNGRIGSVVLLQNQGSGNFVSKTILEHVPRVTFVDHGDLNGDGRIDLVVGMFGFFDGEIRWLEAKADGSFESHRLLDLSGTIHAPIGDMDGDGDLDVVALVSQDWEEIHYFENDGNGEFDATVVYGSMNPNFGSSGLSLADIDGDGLTDILYTNGDGLDYATPGARDWHGLQWLRNEGEGKFEYKRIADVPGAHSPIAFDYDEDGRLDIVVVSGFNDWTSPEAESLVCFLQRDGLTFQKQVLSNEPTHLISIDTGDLNNDGILDLVTGSFLYYPPFNQPSRVTLWERRFTDVE